MPSCTVTRTHRLGRSLRGQFDTPVPGPVEMASIIHPGLKREVKYLTVARQAHFGASNSPPIPDLYEPQIITFGSDRAMMFSGFEQIDGQRYYQGWWIRFDEE